MHYWHFVQRFYRWWQYFPVKLHTHAANCLYQLCCQYKTCMFIFIWCTWKIVKAWINYSNYQFISDLVLCKVCSSYIINKYENRICSLLGVMQAVILTIATPNLLHIWITTYVIVQFWECHMLVHRVLCNQNTKASWPLYKVQNAQIVHDMCLVIAGVFFLPLLFKSFMVKFNIVQSHAYTKVPKFIYVALSWVLTFVWWRYLFQQLSSSNVIIPTPTKCHHNVFLSLFPHYGLNDLCN